MGIIKPLKDRARRIKWLLRVAQGKDVYYKPQINVDIEFIGGAVDTGYGAWPVYTRPLNKDSVVYSVGIGDDISFDIALISRFALKICAFDPTPASIAWLERQTLPALFEFHPYGLAAYDGNATFLAPANPNHVSFSMSHQSDRREESVVVEVRKLATLMQMQQHTSIDVLKMDIEGGEYDVISDLVSANLDVKQLLVEFHHRIPEIGRSSTKKAVMLLNQAGYKIAYISSSGEEYVFLKEGTF